MFLYGASGHGKVVKEILDSQNIVVDGFVDDDISLDSFMGLTVFHSSKDLDSVIVSIGNNSIRKRIVNQLTCGFEKAIHPTAIVSTSAIIGEGTVIMPGVIINADARIGRHCIINTGASIDHECVIGDFVHVAPHASLCGQVHVGEGSLIGVGVSVIPCIRIGEWCVIGAGAAVVKCIPSYSTALGVPAKIIKK